MSVMASPPSLRSRRLLPALVIPCTLALAATAQAHAALPAGPPPHTEVVVYDDFEAPGGYDLGDYEALWDDPYGPGEMAVGGERRFEDGAFTAEALPFRTGADEDVFDHIKYLGVSRTSFDIPSHGSIMFSATIDATTPGTEPGRVVHGTYTQSKRPYAASTLEAQQAAATLHMIDFETGQLFDWFVSGSSAFTLVERLPASVTGTELGGTRETLYTQIIDEVPLTPGPHTVSIRLTRTPGTAFAEYRLDGKLVSKVHKIGVPLDVQGVPWTGTWPAIGAGELVAHQMEQVQIGTGLFSLLDAFPFQHPDAPELHVSIPMEERLFGQGVSASFDDITVTTTTLGKRPPR